MKIINKAIEKIKRLIGQPHQRRLLLVCLCAILVVTLGLHHLLVARAVDGDKALKEGESSVN